MSAILLPALWTKRQSVQGNPIRQLLIREHEAEAVDGELPFVRLENGASVRIQTASALPPDGRALRVRRQLVSQLPDGGDFRAGQWLGLREASSPGSVLASLEGSFDYRRASKTLRAPQIGALHSLLGEWTTQSRDPATVVMPTGTGKTDTMVAVWAAAQIERLLVLVPSDVLRDQIASKFETLGVLQDSGVLPSVVERPVVGQVKHRFSSAESAEEFAVRCNVIVATPDALHASALEARERLLEVVTHLFVDEAHHVAAATWREIRDSFVGRRVVQFTATPFREDGQHLGGRLLYNFPLREAQSQGYFSSIDYTSVVNLEAQDRAVAEKAVARLREDLAAGYDHILMARVRRIGRADEIVAIYEELAPDLRPVVLHSTRPALERRTALSGIRDRSSRIVICVNMLGEGFDEPSFKVAAIHDAHKSLGVTLQFIGRFARSGDLALGRASAVVGRPERSFDPQLRRLYAEDADWNRVIRDLSEGAAAQQEEVSEFESAFGAVPDDVSIRSLLPKMSTVVYQAHEAADWDPAGAVNLFGEVRMYSQPIAVNERDGVAWFVTERRTEVRWGELRTVEEVAYDLFVLYWDRARRLLYVNSSNTASHHEALAKAVVGETARRITGEAVYRVMAQVQRLVPTNVGLLDIRNRSRRFSMLVGADVTEGFPVAEATTKTKTNIFAYGYESGARTSIGASLKGRIWSFRIAPSLKHWVDWCDHIGSKLIDDSISVDAVMGAFIRPANVEERPPLHPLALEWPPETVAALSEELRVSLDDHAWPLFDTELDLTASTPEGSIPFQVCTPDWQLGYEVTLGDGAMRFAPQERDAALLWRGGEIPLSQFLNEHGLLIFFERDAMVRPPAMLLQPNREIPPIDLELLRPLDWTGVDLTVESRGRSRRSDAVQSRVLEHVRDSATWDLVIDDDGTREVADVVAMRVDEDVLHISLVHCKYVSGGVPRAQVEDLYEVCGQAQKSAHWRSKMDTIFEYLLRRERMRLKRGAPSGFYVGEASDLYRLADAAGMLRTQFSIAVAQPGMTKAAASAPQLQLLAATELYVREVAGADFLAFTSE